MKNSNQLFVPPLPKQKTLIQKRAEELGFFTMLPPCKVKKPRTSNMKSISFPSNSNNSDEDYIPTLADGITISLYPYYADRASREGDPICDSFRIHVYENAMIWCLADGCNWGERPKQASIKARDAFVGYMQSKLSEIKTLREVSQLLTNALASSHQSIIHGKTDVFTAGTTTALGGVILQYDDKEQNNWIVCSISVGDCKLFHYSSEERKVYDLTHDNRFQSDNAKDPGGRLGPYIGDGDPDLRNLHIQYKIIKENDLIICVSDGVHDNLDPTILGLDPVDLGLEYDTWDNMPKDIKNEVIHNFMTKKLEKLIHEAQVPSPTLVCKSIINHTRSVVENSKQFLEQNPDDTLVGTDYKEFPGKMDHTTCICMKVGLPNNNSSIDSPQSIYHDVFPY